jgi:uroporphyrinogen III methyltransferase/synthase
MKHQGKVYFLGAGLGKIDYLTLKGKALLNQAEVLIYDALVDCELFQFIQSHCLTIDVGKRGGLPSTSQREINQLLIKYCREGKKVVRLKSGDPLIFGRINEEIEALIQADCYFELIPGISSALAAPLLAGIPLTDKDLSRCFVILTGHKPEILDWKSLAKIDTLVILMGGSNLSEIMQKLQNYGRSPHSPVAIIHQGGRFDQQVWQGTLTDIVDQVSSISLSPCVIVIGEIVKKREKILKFSSKMPLTGKNILVTRSAEQSSQFTSMLQQQGANVIEMPALEITPPSSWEGLDQAIADLKSFHWLILTSANGVEYFFERLNYFDKDSRDLAGIKIAVVGKKTANFLQKYGLKPDFIPPNFVADSLVENFPEAFTNLNILFPRVESGGRDILVKDLTEKGAKVIEIAAYQSACPDHISPLAWEALKLGKVDFIAFASSKTVKNFAILVNQAIANDTPDLTLESLLKNVIISSIGPQTSQTCLELFGRVDLEAKEYTLEGLTEAIYSYQPSASQFFP